MAAERSIGNSLATEAVGCEHLFVTSQRHPYAIFRRAIERKVAGAAWAAAHDVAQLNLRDALDLEPVSE
jgi:hypothetical protein